VNEDMRPWFEFYSVTGAVAATLMGLLFVAVSINAALILGAGQEHSKRLAEQAFQSYYAVIIVSLLALFPQITLPHLGLAILCVTAAPGAWLLVRLYLSFARRMGESRVYALRRYASPLIGFGLLLFCASGMWFDHGDYRNRLAISVLVLLFSSTVVCWELLIRIAKTTLNSHQR
jgi:hypothetical protein